MIIYGISILFLLGTFAFAHESHKHHTASKTVMPNILQKINAEYLGFVKPIFERSCYNCHSSSTLYPWYAGLPGAKQLIASDIAKANTHLNMTPGFPFKGHGAPKDDLIAIKESILKGSMPPLRYKILHPSSRLTEEEKKLILSWVEESLKSLN